jgi:predicted RNA methylase
MKTLSGGQLAGGNTTIGERAEHDYYATDPKTTTIFLEEFCKHHKLGTVLEPACGAGHMSNVIEEYTDAEVVIADLVDRGIGAHEIDFLTYEFEGKFDTVMTNPPFSLAQEFIEKALTVSRRYVIMLCKIQLLEGDKRKGMFENTPLKYVYVHTKRQATWKNGEPLDPQGKKWATTMCLAWFVWEHGYEGEPMIRFL